MSANDEETIEALLATMRALAEEATEPPPPLHLPRCRGCDGLFPPEALIDGYCAFCCYDT